MAIGGALGQKCCGTESTNARSPPQGPGGDGRQRCGTCRLHEDADETISWTYIEIEIETLVWAVARVSVLRLLLLDSEAYISSADRESDRRSETHSRTPTPRQEDGAPDNQQQVVQRSRWQAVLLEAGGIGAAVSEESMRRLKYCLQWLQVSTASGAVTAFRTRLLSQSDMRLCSMPRTKLTNRF